LDIPALAFEKVLHNAGYKMTAQRLAVLEAMQKKKDVHPCTEEIFEEVEKSYPGIGLSTVYRTLQLFTKLGLVQHLLLDDGCTRFQLIDPREKHRHHHLVCEICGKVSDMRGVMLEELEETILKENGFTVKDHDVRFTRICKKCAAEESKLKSGEK
jgi:Fur family ferric uptake transcriptional regulator